MEQTNSHKNNMKSSNIIWIVLDHVTFRHYKKTKGTRQILSTYERLASEGMEFTNCHSAHPLCLPVRASMMTGMYSHNHGAINNDTHLTEEKYPLYNQYLLEKGYKVGYFGKNHCGLNNLSNYGFDGFSQNGYGNPYMSIEYREYLKDIHVENSIYHQEWSTNDSENGEYDLTQVDHFNKYSSGYFKTPGPVHEADFLTYMALKWLEENVNDNDNYCLRVDMWGPHHAFQVALEFKDLINQEEIEEYPSYQDEMLKKPQFVKDFLKNLKDRNPNLKNWSDWQPVMKRAYENYSYIDKVIGGFIDEVEKRGLMTNTIVILTADHGDALGSHGGMVDKAGDMMEEVMHIPLVIKGTGIMKGTISNSLVSNLDLVPTVLDLAGINPPEYMDGKSIRPLLKGEIDEVREDFMAEHYGHFKVHAPQRALYYNNFKYVANSKDCHELYDIKNDPFELVNLIKEPSKAHILKEMQRRLLVNMEQYKDNSQDAQNIVESMKLEN